MKLGLLAGLVLAISATAGSAQDMTPPRLASAPINWAEAVRTLSPNRVLLRPPGPLGKTHTMRADIRTAVPAALARLNSTMATRFPGAAQSPVPVLLPLDTEAVLRDQAAGRLDDNNERYLSGFHARSFFFPGPSGYDAAFSIRASDVPELADIKFLEPIDVQISGSALIYELDDVRPILGTPVSELESEFPGIRRLIHEHHVRYTFVRFGVPYVVSIGCFDAGVPRYRMPTCRSADRIATRFLRALRIVGGTPQRLPLPELPPIERPQAISPSFTYRPPGRLLAGTGFRGQGGRADTTVYSQIRFPLAEAPAFVNSQMFQNRNRPVAPGQSANYAYPWRDNFCERRGFPVGQCPAGVGHQGQDIRRPPCTPEPGESRCRPSDKIVAVRDSAVLRAPKQEALYLVVNTAREHLRFRYLHMHPMQMDADNLFSGRHVQEGDVLGRVSNFNKREGGTSYHLHFDVQVPTRHGWVFVNPYMTLVAAYERLIGARGEKFVEPAVVASTDPGTAVTLIAEERATPRASKSKRYGKRAAHRYGKHKAGRYKKHTKSRRRW